MLLSAYLCTSTRPRLRGSHVLELGSGCGLVGLVAQRLGAEVGILGGLGEVRNAETCRIPRHDHHVGLPSGTAEKKAI